MRAWIFSLCALLVCSGCNYRSIKAPTEDSSIQEVDLHQTDFATAMSKVIRPKCVSCHNAKDSRGGVRLDNYALVQRSLSQIQDSIEDGSMPKNSALSIKQKKLILGWIKAGGPQTKAHATAVPTAVKTEDLALNFATVKARVLDPACLNCHSSERTEGKLKVETYADVAQNAAKIAKSVLDGSMPKKGKMTEVQKALIINWLNNGAPEQSTKTMSTANVAQKTDTAVRIHDPAVLKNTFEQEITARGKYLYDLSSCANCHTADAAKPLAGGKELETPFGSFYSPNISGAPNTGIGKWSANDFLRAMRDGIGPQGQRYFPSFPFTSYSKMSNEDILAIRAYILTLPKTEKPNKPHSLRFPYSQRWLLKAWQMMNFPDADDEPSVKNVMVARGPFQQVPEKSLAWNRGAYLVEGPLHCAQCHTPRGELGGLILEKWMGGSAISGGAAPAPNLTPDKETGLGSWSQNTWSTLLTDGLTPKGEKVGGEMWHVVKDATSQLTDADRSAVIEYLQALPPVKSK
ncbi:MAG: cytochrome c [Bdellovibrionales bacterium]